MNDIRLELTSSPKEKPHNEKELGFGKIFTDHMFIMEYETGMGWHNARIVPYDNITISPAAMCLHYAQEVFEGLKAYRTKDNQIQLFRPDENFKRMNVSNKRLVIPEIDVDFCIKALKTLVEIDKDWVPSSEDTSLYIRPFVIAVDPYIGVRPADKYLFMIIMSPSGAYYASGLNPVSIYVEKNYVRSVQGGVGYTKTGGNYAASLIGQDEAHKQNYSQVLWLDGVEKKYIEEVGAMNIFFIIDNVIITPELHGSILSGITRKSVIELCKSWGMDVVEKRITIQEVADAYDSGHLQEVFGTGTAAVISPVGNLKWGDKVMLINDDKIGPVSQRLFDTLTGIQYGKLEDAFNWIYKI
jgi:branched-chain amino acid aminotransferase